MKRPGLKLPTPNRAESFAAVSLMICTVALTDWLVSNPWLGFLYFLPIIFSAEFLGERVVVFFGVTCTILEQQFGIQSWHPEFALRFATALINFVGIGLMVSGIVRRRALWLEREGRMKNEEQRRRDADQLRYSAEQQLRSLVEGSPAAILTIDPQGHVIQIGRAHV